MKLPTTFQELDLTGFDIETKQYNSITKSMVDIACAVLKKNQVGIVIRSVQSALKYIYGIGGSSDTVCDFLRQWRAENMALKRNEKGLISGLLESVDDGVLDVSDIPEDYLTAMNQWAIAVYKLAYQNADTSVSGDRIKYLVTENELLKEQLTDFPGLQLELNFYKSECERQRSELKEAYMNIDKQKLTEGEEVESKLDALHQERIDLVIRNRELANKLAESANLEAVLQAQLQEANATITNLQSQQGLANTKISSISRQ